MSISFDRSNTLLLLLRCLLLKQFFTDQSHIEGLASPLKVDLAGVRLIFARAAVEKILLLVLVLGGCRLFDFICSVAAVLLSDTIVAHVSRASTVVDIHPAFGVFSRWGDTLFYTFLLLVDDDDLGPDIPQSWIQAVVRLGTDAVSAHRVDFAFDGLMLKQASVFDELMLVCG